MKTFVPRIDLDRSLRSGERQVAEDLSKIDPWHVWRYEQAAAHLRPDDYVVDLGCGIGYGSRVMSERAEFVLGVDDSEETIVFAKQTYGAMNIEFICRDILEYMDEPGEADAIVAFEVLEHLENDQLFFDKLSKLFPRLLFLSVPHVSVDLGLSPFHYRHYTEDQIASLVKGAGFRVLELSLKQFTKGKAVYCVGAK